MRPATSRDFDVSQVGARLKLLAEPTRLRIFELLLDGTRCNCELGGELGLAPNLISHHLSVLRTAGLVDAARDPRDARWIYYTLNRDALAELHATLGAFFNPARVRTREPVCCASADVAGARDGA